MREMKDSGIEWIGKIPADWKCCKQKYELQLINGRAYSDSEFEEDGKYRVLRVGNLFSNPTWYTSSLELSPDKYCCAGDLLYSWSMSYAPVIWNGEKVIYHYHIWKVQISQNLSKKFAYYYLLSLTDALKAKIHETTMGFITMGIMNNSYIAFPDLNTQNTVASFLDSKCSEIDALIVDIQSEIDTLEKYKKAVITEAVTKGLDKNVKMKDSGIEWIGEIPENWQTKRIKYLLNERNSRSILGNEEPLSMSQKYGLIPTNEMENIPNMASTNVGAKLTYIDDLVLNKLKAHLGVFSVSKYMGLVSPDYSVYYTKGNCNIKYLEYLFKTDLYINEFKKRITGVGTGLSRLYTTGLFDIRAIYPPITEQNKIVEFINNKVKQIDEVIRIKNTQIETMSTYKKSLIYEYVTGKKEVG